jgi:hypothetical protein
MFQTLRPVSRHVLLAAMLAGTASLSGCILITDTSRMNPDVFVQETAPVFYNPSAPPEPQPQPM